MLSKFLFFILRTNNIDYRPYEAVLKISFVKPEACTIIYSTASPVFKFIKQRNKKSILKKKRILKYLGLMRQ